MATRSRTLFHFTKNLDTLKYILADGFWPRYCAEDTRWHGQADAQTIAFPMVCFCDIPLSRISDHVNFYGEYGLGMTREWATTNGLNPILYLAGDNNLMAQLRKLSKDAHLLAEGNQESAKKTIRYIYAHTKPVRGVMIVDGAPVEKDFYLESEWRHVPKHKDIKEYLRHTIFSDLDLLSEENQRTSQHCRLRFTPKDVKYIFVRADSDIPEIINFIQTQLDHHPHADTKVLMSRVTSLESLQGDV